MILLVSNKFVNVLFFSIIVVSELQQSSHFSTSDNFFGQVIYVHTK